MLHSAECTASVSHATSAAVRGDWVLKLPRNLARFENENFKEVRLVYDKSRRRCYWHVVIEDGRQPGKPTGNGIAGIDLGEIHPAAITDGTNGLVISCREMRATKQYTNKRLATLKRLQSSKQKYSRRCGKYSAAAIGSLRNRQVEPETWNTQSPRTAAQSGADCTRYPASVTTQCVRHDPVHS